MTTSAVSTQPSPGNCRSGVTSRARHSFISRSTTCAVHSVHTATHCDPAVVAGPGPMFSAAHLHILYLHIVTHCRPPPAAATLCLPVISDIADWCSSTMVGVYFSSSTWLLGEDCCQCSAVSVTTTRGGHSSDDGRCGAKWLEILTSAEPFIIQWDSETDSAHRIHHPRSCCNHLTLAMEQLQLRQRWTCSLIGSNAR